MKYPVGRICLLLAGAEISPKEIREFALWVQDYGATNFIDTVERLRRFAEDATDPSRSAPFKYSEANNVLQQKLDIAEKIERLLISEANLTKTRAADLLREALLEETPLSDIPELGRTAFSTWIERIAERVPGSVLLHIATKLRNQYVHIKGPDWPLRQK